MSVNDLAQELEDAAKEAIFTVKAVEACRFHPEVTIRLGDYEAERRAYAIATNRLKSNETMFLREELMSAIQNELDMAADDECPACGSIKDA